MSLLIKVSQNEYETFKRETLENELIMRVPISSNELRLKDFKTIVYATSSDFGGDGVSKEIPITREAVIRLLEILRIPYSMMEAFHKNFEENSERFFNQIVQVIRKGNIVDLVLVYNTTLKKVVNVYKRGGKLISDPQYFDILERLIQRTDGGFLRNISRSPEGDLSATVKVPTLGFQFGNFSNEAFEGGFTLDLTPAGLKSSFFTERLVCTNGMIAERKLCSKEVYAPEGVSDFISDVMDKNFQLNNISEFKKKINRTMSTQASLNEVLDARRGIIRFGGQFSDRLVSRLSVDEIEATFNAASPEYLTNREMHRHLYTNISLWDLINEITSVSSLIEQQDIPIGERANRQIQLWGGHFLFKEPDLTPNNIVQVFEPNQFANPELVRRRLRN